MTVTPLQCGIILIEGRVRVKPHSAMGNKRLRRAYENQRTFVVMNCLLFTIIMIQRETAFEQREADDLTRYISRFYRKYVVLLRR